MGPDWTLLFGAGSDLPQPTQGKTLTVLEVDNLFEAVSKFDGVLQTLGLGMADPEKEKQARDAGRAEEAWTESSSWDACMLLSPVGRG